MIKDKKSQEITQVLPAMDLQHHFKGTVRKSLKCLVPFEEENYCLNCQAFTSFKRNENWIMVCSTCLQICYKDPLRDSYINIKMNPITKKGRGKIHG